MASMLATFALVLLALRAELPEKTPSPAAPPHTWHAAAAKSGLRYAWMVPKGYDGKTARNLTVILHGTGLDHRWGPANHPAGVFRPEDVVVSVDGPTPDGQSRLFLGERKDSDAFAAFLAEMRAAFAVDRVYLYGHSQGGFFVVYFAGEHPELVAGVVAHASGAWNWSKMGAPVKKVAIAFQHGTRDPVVPYRQSPASRDAYADAGFPLLHLRRLQSYNHWPNAVRSTESLDWCEGMTTADSAAALAAARRILTPKKADEYQWETIVGFAGARDVLRRLEKKGPAAFADVPAEVAAGAAELVRAIEEHAAKHVAELEKSVKSRKELALGKAAPWLGHLVALREDFRGVDAVEAYAKRIGYDEALKSQAKATSAILDAWYAGTAPKKTFQAVVEKIDEAFLFEGFPPELEEKMKEWKQQAKKNGIDAKMEKLYPAFEAWQDGWTEGQKRYKALWKDWK